MHIQGWADAGRHTHPPLLLLLLSLLITYDMCAVSHGSLSPSRRYYSLARWRLLLLLLLLV
jgi:hypothetical protein